MGETREMSPLESQMFTEITELRGQVRELRGALESVACDFADKECMGLSEFIEETKSRYGLHKLLEIEDA